MITDANIKTVLFHKTDEKQIDYSVIFNTLQKDPTNSGREAIDYIYLQLKSTAAPDEETARATLDKLFFSDKRYDLGEVGRYRINKKLNLNIPMETGVLTNEDIISIIRYLIELINSKTEVDDIDHLSNRRIRTVGEQLYNQFSVGLNRMARTIREKMNVRDHEVFAPVDLINAKTLSSVVTYTKFDASFDIDVRLGVDPRKANQMVRGIVTLPHGTGKVVRVLALCTPDKEEEAKAAGADYVGLDEYVDKGIGGGQSGRVCIFIS